jgi:hypothetical protein
VLGLVQQNNQQKVLTMHTFTPGLMHTYTCKLEYRAYNVVTRPDMQHHLTKLYQIGEDNWQITVNHDI